METRIIELSVILNTKQFNILNTDMDVLVNWDMDIKKTEKEAKIFYSVVYMKGSFCIHSESELYERKSTYKFKTDNTWSYSTVPPNFTDVVYPSSAVVNFDNKTINIKF